MLEHKNLLWIIPTTSDAKPTFYVLACCIAHAADLAEIFCEEDKQLLINPATTGEDAGKKPDQSSSSKAN